MNRPIFWAFTAAIIIFGYLVLARQTKLGEDLAALSLTVKNISAEQDKAKAQRARLIAPTPVAPVAIENEAVIKDQVLVSTAEIDDPFLGSKNAPVVVMVFNDYECQRCNTYSRILYESIYQDFSKDEVKFIYRDLPLDQHHWAKQAATMANCIGEQGKYWDAFDQLTKLSELTEKSLLSVPALVTGLNEGALKSCISSARYDNELLADATDAHQLGARGAPGTFVALRIGPESFQGDFIRGAQPYELIREEILRSLQKSEAISADKQ